MLFNFAMMSTWNFFGRSIIYPIYLSPLRHIPTVLGCPLWGQTYTRLTNEIGVPERTWHEDLGPIIRFHLPFGTERISIVDEQALREINVRNPHYFVRPAQVIRWMIPILGERGILLANGVLHVRQRKALAFAFSPASIRRLECRFWEKGFCLTDELSGLLDCSLQEHGSDGCLDGFDWIQHATFDLIGLVSFDWDVNSLGSTVSPLRNVFAEIFALDTGSCLVQTLRLYLNFVKYLLCKMNRAIDSGSKVLKEISEQILPSKLKDMDSTIVSDDIISQIISQNEKLPHNHPDRLSYQEIKHDIMTIFGAGHDTTAAALAWTLDQLSKHPSKTNVEPKSKPTFLLSKTHAYPTH
ncbi:Hypothetical protein R9X50_00463300 [Acrodontium crateriforme]|uniref:Cytochrome P450 n=1 Tax=Acrodontium crateriforme TaxID=150365 RepID=A0AAQ3M5P4_9PEZI|nr:Hypothetical protein R9X50_00463300 [Acrodontium crateriforme]